MKLSDALSDYLSHTPFVAEALQEGVINITALARQIKPDLEKKLDKELQVASIVMAIKRLPPSPIDLLSRSINEVFDALGDVIVRSNLMEFTYANSASLRQCQSKLLLHSSVQLPSSFYSFSCGLSETTMVVSRVLSPTIYELFGKENLLFSTSGLAAISMILPADNIHVSGLYYTLLKQLAWYHINVIEIISTSGEISIIVREENVDEVFGIVMKLKSSGQR